MARDNWRRVDRKHPCPKCGKDHWCQYLADGTVMCMRVADGGRHGVDRNGQDFWIHRPDGVGAPPPRDPEPVADPAAACATVEIRDRVYRALLDALTLEPGHRAQLRARGVSDADMDRRVFRTHPGGEARWRVARAMAERFGPDLAHVPGFYVATSARGHRYWTLAGPPGFFIPARDPAGRIVALLIRPDVIIGDVKYLYFSSKDHKGPGCGAPVHVPISDAPRDRVGVVEGIAKADYVAAQSPELAVVGIPSHSAWRAVLPILEVMGARVVCVMPDADFKTKPDVARSLRALWKALGAKGYQREIEKW